MRGQWQAQGHSKLSLRKGIETTIPGSPNPRTQRLSLVGLKHLNRSCSRVGSAHHFPSNQPNPKSVSSSPCYNSSTIAPTPFAALSCLTLILVLRLSTREHDLKEACDWSEIAVSEKDLWWAVPSYLMMSITQFTRLGLFFSFSKADWIRSIFRRAKFSDERLLDLFLWCWSHRVG